MSPKNNFAYSLLLTARAVDFAAALPQLTQVVAAAGAEIFAVEPVNAAEKKLTVLCHDLAHEQQVVAALRASPEKWTLTAVIDRVFAEHQGGKLVVNGARPLLPEELAIAYTPGVARPCLAISADRRQADHLTIKGKTVAVVSDGTAVLGLGDIGPEAAMPVMEGKCLLFKHFAGVDAFPICLATKDVDEIVATVERLAPTFGGINLEDIAAPRCFAIEARLKKSLSIPVFHDDQHGTAIVVLAGLLNALKVSGKNQDCRVVINGAGSAGLAIAKMLLNYGFTDLTLCDRAGILHRDNPANNAAQQAICALTNRENRRGVLADALNGADVFIGVSAAKVVSEAMVATLAPDAVVFAMANPEPEIMPEIAAKYVKVMATGRSDYPNQINNVLAFPGIFRGALDARATAITEKMKLAAALAIAASVPPAELSPTRIIPSPFDPAVAKKVAAAVSATAREEGVIREWVAPLTFDELRY
ncbi:MAG: NADP-dependent malic enzyme [Planctomycetota bacterium]|jgi:malate dehydrogenase (oxaloacetate-decarboxylating)|nr:NADP-dependent malic enzyme [Planctomycetota bacterium]